MNHFIKSVLKGCAVGATVAGVASLAIAHWYPTTSAVASSAPLAARHVPSATVPEELEVIESVVPGVPGQWVLVQARASVSSEDGPQVQLTASPSPAPCEEPRWLDARTIRMSKPSVALDVQAEMSWCLRVTPGQSLTPTSLDGQWRTVNGKLLEADSANSYLSLQHSSGRKLGMRAVAVGHCYGESDACSASAGVEVSVDDQNLVLPLRVSADQHTLVRLAPFSELAP